MYFISQEDLITYESLVQEATQEYRNIVDSKQWEPATSKEKSQDQPSLPKAYTVAIGKTINTALKQVDLKSRRRGNGSGSGRGSSARSDITCHKCGKQGHIQIDCRSKVNGSSGNSPKKFKNELQNGWLRSLLSQIPKIWQQPPWPATTIITSGAPLAIMGRVHGDFTKKKATRSGKISKARSHLFVFPILPPIQ